MTLLNCFLLIFRSFLGFEICWYTVPVLFLFSSLSLLFSSSLFLSAPWAVSYTHLTLPTKA